MQLSVYNFKGGVGKTSIALNLALELGCGVITNDLYSPLERVLDQKSFLKVGDAKTAKMMDNVLDDFPELPDNINVIYDLGGFLDLRVGELLNKVDVVVIPTGCDLVEIQTTINCVAEIEEATDKILIIVNKTVKGDFEPIKDEILKHYDYPIFELKKSRALPAVFEEQKSINELIKEGGLRAYSFAPVAEQFDAILSHVKRS